MAWHVPVATSWVGLVVGILALVTSLHFAANRGCQWWQPSSGVVVAVAIVAVSTAYLIKGDAVTSPLLIGALLLAHLVFGITFSIQEKPWM